MNKEQENKYQFNSIKGVLKEGHIMLEYDIVKELNNMNNRIKQLEYYDTSKIKEAKAQANAEIERLSNMLGHYEDELVKTKEKVIKEFKEKLKKNWKVKARRMNIMSEEVAIYELKNEIDKTAEEILSPNKSGRREEGNSNSSTSFQLKTKQVQTGSDKIISAKGKVRKGMSTIAIKIDKDYLKENPNKSHLETPNKKQNYSDVIELIDSGKVECMIKDKEWWVNFKQLKEMLK
jgi:hypothetical protein